MVAVGLGCGQLGLLAGKFNIGPDGRISTAAPYAGPSFPYPMERNPQNTRALVSRDGRVVILKQLAYESTNLVSPVRRFPSPIFAMSPGAEIVATESAILDYPTGNPLYELPTASTVQTITSDHARLIYFDSAARALKSVNLFEKIGDVALRRGSIPSHQAIVLPPTSLQWAAVAGVRRYRVYFGTSQNAVAQAGPATAEYLGETASSTLPLTPAPTPGRTYYWRVDAVMENETSPGQVQSFRVANIATDIPAVEAATVRGHSSHAAPIELTAASPRNWTASASVPWITFAAASGTTPATLRASLDATALPTRLAQGEIRLSEGGDTLVIPVRLHVEPLALTVIRSDPRSARVYAISEYTPPSSSSGNTPPKAYLLELDSQARAIARVVPVGSSATDLAIHEGDRRIYVTNWRSGSLLALNQATLALERTYPFEPFGGIGSQQNDVYRVAAGGPGRVVVEEADQWVDITLLDTATGSKLATADTHTSQGSGQYSPDNRYYFHGDTGSELTKFDTTADRLTRVASQRLSPYSGRALAISEDGLRLFWGGYVLTTADLSEIWNMRDVVYAASREGRYAFSETKIYDVNERRAVLGMPVATKVSAYNTTSNRLVLQQDQRIAFLTVDPAAPLATPALALETSGPNSLKLTWTHEGLQNGFTLQMRVTGTPAWRDVSTSIASTISTYTVTSLTSETAYEFRIKADNGSVSSPWSDTLAATTGILPPNPPNGISVAATSPTEVTVFWAATVPYDVFVIERSTAGVNSQPWAVVATVATPERTYVDSGLTASTTYLYRFKVIVRGISSAYSTPRGVTLQPPARPTFTRQPQGQTVLAGTAITLSVSVNGNPVPTFQWYRNGELIGGATGATLQIASAAALDGGIYKVVATNSEGSVTSNEFTLTVTPATSRMINFSVLAEVSQGEVLTVGFTLNGGSKNVLVRGLGPTLGGVGVAGALPDPHLALYRHAGNNTVALLTNNDWSLASNRNAIATAASQVAALPFIADPSRDSAALLAINIDGGYSMQISSTNDQRGLALAEIYDTDRPSLSRLSNISALMPVAPRKVLTAGFVLSGNTRKTVLVRAVGPGLAQIGVGDYLADPQLTLYRQGPTPTPINGNNDWDISTNRAEILTATPRVTSLALPSGSKDAAFLSNLEPGAYTAQAASADGSSGLVLIEVYEVP